MTYKRIVLKELLSSGEWQENCLDYHQLGDAASGFCSRRVQRVAPRFFLAQPDYLAHRNDVAKVVYQLIAGNRGLV